ncbi:hypothetical protein BC834DRAFT_74826 [Gloeopeniophorella convolvens]|nr:hypothetical protein BC834DRAFT_74826 [Gloeopeniophorella convolvens]
MDIALLFGTTLIAVFLNATLFGVLGHQYRRYYSCQFEDSTNLKALLFFLFILHTVHLPCLLYIIWLYAVRNYGDPSIFLQHLWPNTLSPLLMMLATFGANAFMMTRILQLTQDVPRTAVISLLCSAALMLGLGVNGIAWAQDVPATRFAQHVFLDRLAIAWRGVQALVDGLIMSHLVYFLARDPDAFRKTDTPVHWATRSTMQTYFLAAVFSLATVVSFAVIPGSTLYTIFAVNNGLVCTISLMSTLLDREPRGSNTPQMPVPGVDFTLSFRTHPATSTKTDATVTATATMASSDRSNDHQSIALTA